jgi:hypothetical protein
MPALVEGERNDDDGWDGQQSAPLMVIVHSEQDSVPYLWQCNFPIIPAVVLFCDELLYWQLNFTVVSQFAHMNYSKEKDVRKIFTVHCCLQFRHSSGIEKPSNKARAKCCDLFQHGGMEE